MLISAQCEISKDTLVHNFLHHGKSLDDIDEEVKNIRFLNCLSNIFLLKGSSLVQLRIVPTAYTQIQNKKLARLGKENWSLGRDHADIFVRLHNTLDTSKWQIIVSFKVLFCLILIFLNNLDLLFPEVVETTVELCQKLWA